MGYSPWDRKESNMTERTLTVLCVMVVLVHYQIFIPNLLGGV